MLKCIRLFLSGKLAGHASGVKHFRLYKVEGLVVIPLSYLKA